MSVWSKLLPPAPWDQAKDFVTALKGNAPAGQAQHPWLQQVARNVGHASFGDEIGNRVDRRFLGDQPLPAAEVPYVPNTEMTAQPMVSQAQGTAALEQLLAQFLQSR